MKTIRVAIALVWDQERLLVTRRPEGTHLAGHWEFPGGKLEPGEAAESCAVREVLEEVGLRVAARSMRTPIEHTYSDRSVVSICSLNNNPQTTIGIVATAIIQPSLASAVPSGLPRERPLTTAATIRTLSRQKYVKTAANVPI